MAGMTVPSSAPPNGKNDHSINEQKALLNTYIHNYLVHEGHFDLAKNIRNSNLSLNAQRLKKENGNSRQQMNGADDSNDGDSKDDLINRTDGPNKLGDTFLLDYWFIFWDMWSHSKRNASERQTDEPLSLYWEHQKGKKALAGQQMMPQNMMPNGLAPFNRPNMMPNPQFNNLQKTAMVNNGRTMNNPQLQNIRVQQQLQAQQMPMDGSEMDLNGNPRPPSPMSGGENAPSPSKRPRVDNGAFNAGPAMAGRNPMVSQLPNGAPGNADAMRMQNPKNFSPDQLTQMMTNSTRNYAMTMANSTKAAMNGGMPNGVPAGMPQMSPDMPDGSPNGSAEMMMYANGGGKGVGGGNGGALADYQMQLMLLEQQNKKRLMVARQENAHDPQRFGNQAIGAPAMSPHGSKTGHSPPGSDRQRGTPRMGQGGSPLPDGSQNRSSPAPGAFGDMNAMGMGQPFMHPNSGPMMRPPGSNPPGTPNSNHPMNAPQFEMFQRNNGRIPSGNWGNPGMPGQMPPQAHPQPGNPDNNQQRGNMPPPQAPPATGKPSPTQSSAPTPNASQGNAKNTKKKEAKEPKKKATKKNNQSTTAATPSNDAERPPTPTPQTPITPVNPESHVIKGQQPPNSQSQPQTQSNNATAPSNMAASQDNNSVNNPTPFGNLSSMDPEMFNVDYMDGHNDVLDAFDFDTFLDPGAMDGTMDANTFPDFQLPADGMEAGTGDP